MLSRIFFLAVFLASAAFVVREKLRLSSPPPPPPPAAETARRQPLPPIFTAEEIDAVRGSLKDSDPRVRWAAAELLFGVRDPQLSGILEQMIAEDPDPEVRVKVLGLMRNAEEYSRLGTLVRALSDPDKDVRAAALQTLGDTADPSVLLWVTNMLKDPEPTVRVAAIRALGRFEERRQAEFRALAEKLKTDYEEAVRRAAARR